MLATAQRYVAVL